MDAIPRLNRAFSDSEWKEAWQFAPKVPKLVRQLDSGQRCSVRESLHRAAYFVGGKLHDVGFSVFNNGGQPLLRRDREGWSDEILFHAPTTSIAGVYCPASIEILVQLHALRDIRQKYSRSFAMVPAFVASANLGQFETPPCRILWNLEDHENVEVIADMLYRQGLDWIEDLCDPVRLEDRAMSHRLPLVDDVTALEMVLSVGGRHAAARVMEEWLDEPGLGDSLREELRRLAKVVGPVYRGDSPGQNLAVICVCYDLLRSSQRR